MALFNIQIAFLALVILTVVAVAFLIFKAHKSGLLKSIYTRIKGTRFNSPVVAINLEPQWGASHLPAPVTPVHDLPQRQLFQITNYERIEYFSTPLRQAAIN